MSPQQRLQTPPALPTLFIVRLASLLLGSRVIIDWHNLGYTILALRMGASSPLVSLARLLERWTGRSAYAHLFVTRAMMQHLDEAWGLKGRKVVLHDRPPQHFRRSNVEETHALWTRLAPRISPGCDGFWPSFEAQHSSPFTTVTRSSGGEGDMQEAELRQDRPALVVSSTSWTADEDFSLLLRAASLYERRARELAAQQAERARASSRHASPTLAEPARAPHARSKGHSSPTLEEPEWHGGGIATRRRSTSRSSSLELDTSLVSGNSNIESTRDRSRRASADLSGGGMPLLPNEPAARLPKMLLVVTGKGELRAQYEREIALLEREEKWEYVRIRTAWLEMEEYPVLLGE
jgi:beta-1,4-mannosyltransferase